MDIWVDPDRENALRAVAALRQFGFAQAALELFSMPDQMIRMGVPPLRLEILTSISGVEFTDCYSRKRIADVDGLPVPVIHLDDLKSNKKASGRAKDLADLDELD